ncbi:hypothetical protein Tco_0493766 [Tanacetum coccineum]
MSNPLTPLLKELSHAADSNDIRDQLSVLLQREVVKDLQKMEDYRRLSSELREAVRMRDGYISELQMSDSSNEVAESIEIMRSMQLDDMEKASRLLLMATELQIRDCKMLCMLYGISSLFLIIVLFHMAA